MTKELLAEQLTGKSRRESIPVALAKLAEDNGLIIVHGYSDDGMSFAGAIDDEAGCSDGGDVVFTKKGKFPTEDHLEHIKEIENELDFVIDLPLNKITANWCPDDIEGNPSWTYTTDIPHATFIMKGDDEEDDIYCIGIVFAMSDLK